MMTVNIIILWVSEKSFPLSSNILTLHSKLSSARIPCDAARKLDTAAPLHKELMCMWCSIKGFTYPVNASNLTISYASNLLLLMPHRRGKQHVASETRTSTTSGLRVGWVWRNYILVFISCGEFERIPLKCTLIMFCVGALLATDQRSNISGILLLIINFSNIHIYINADAYMYRERGRVTYAERDVIVGYCFKK